MADEDYMHIYICTYLHVYTSICVCIYIHICIYVHTMCIYILKASDALAILGI